MKTRNTILLLLIAIGLFVYIKFYESKRPGTKEAEEQGRHLVTFDRDKITGITITNNEDKLELRRDGNEKPWRLEVPVKDRADTNAIDQLLTSIETLDKAGTIEEDPKVNIKDFGVSKSNVRLKLLGPGAPPEILFGKDAAVEGKSYVRLDGSNTVFVVRNDLRNQITKKADDFRDHKLSELSGAEVTKVAINTGAGEIELQKSRDHWMLNKPIKARADDQKVSDLIAQTVNARIDKFVSEKDASASGAAMAEPRGTVSLFTEGSENAAVLKIGQSPENDKNNLYATLSTRNAVHLLPKSIGDVLAVKPNDLRDKHLVRINLDIVDRINIEAANRPRIVLARHEENWTIKSSGDKPANDAEVRRLATELQNEQVTAFVADVAADLPKYGLDQPQLKVTFSSFASENTAESKAGENPIVTVSFGKVEGDDLYARLEDEPFIVSVSKSILDRIFTDPAKWQALEIFRYKPDEITSIEVTKAGEPPVAATRTDKGDWKAASGASELNETNVQSLCNTLATLHAVRWTGSATTNLGFENPTLTLTFATTGNKTGKLTLGSATSDGMWNATAEGETGAFVLSKPDVEALQAVLTKAAASPAPAATVPPAAKP